MSTEAESLDVIRNCDNSLFILAIQQSSLLKDFTNPPPPSKSGLNLVCNVNIVHGNLKSDNSSFRVSQIFFVSINKPRVEYGYLYNLPVEGTVNSMHGAKYSSLF